MKGFLAAAALLAGLSGGAMAADPGLYPGAKLDPEVTRKAAQAAPGGVGPDAVATTTDPFEKVLAFYAASGTVVTFPPRRGQPDTGHERELPAAATPGKFVGSGIKVKQAMVILDGASDLTTSKNWVAITRPFIFNTRIEGGRYVYEDVRDITVIIQSKP